MEYAIFLKQLKGLVEQTSRYTPPNRQRDYMDNYDRYVDFPYVDDEEGYVTHRAMEQGGSDASHKLGTPPQPKKSIASEQETEPAIKPEEKGKEAGASEPIGGAEGGSPEDMAGGDMPGMGADMGMGMGMPGMEQEEPLTSSQVGRVYELKKIYSRLSSVETYLSRATDEAVSELSSSAAQSIDIFVVVHSNYDQFKDKVDDIIVQFYEFLDIIYSSLRKYYKGMTDIRS